jgi:hypothetical protein
MVASIETVEEGFIAFYRSDITYFKLTIYLYKVRENYESTREP